MVWYLLQKYMAEDLPSSVLQLGQTLESFWVDGDDILHVQVKGRQGGILQEKTCRVLVGTDGIHSTVRTHLFGLRELTFHGKLMFRGVLSLQDVNAGTCPETGVSVSFAGDEKGKLFALRETSPGK